MKIEGRLSNVTVEVLIDSGASHSFISPELITALGLAVTPTNVKSIKLGDGHRVKSEGICKGLKIILGSHEFEIDALVLGLGGLDVVLGVSWLSTLGKVMMDWKDLSMQFWHKGQMVTLQGQGNGHLQHGFLNSFLEDRKGGRDDEWWWPHNDTNNDQEEPMKQGMMEVLELFPEVFKEHI
ncbi:RNA-directed DNA polymerase (Reverse transcriptase), partial [Trifolium medium]|nr:RNA-directed DNA polymerase (Reverse transcriptase) [Trifolium medium]